VNAVISVIDVGSSNEVWRYHRSEVWPSHWDVGGSNEIWRYHRSELRPLHSDSKYSCEGSKRISDMFLCHIHLLNALISVIVALGYSPNQRCLKYDRCRVTLMSVVQMRSRDTILYCILNAIWWFVVRGSWSSFFMYLQYYVLQYRNFLKILSDDFAHALSSGLTSKMPRRRTLLRLTAKETAHVNAIS